MLPISVRAELQLISGYVMLRRNLFDVSCEQVHLLVLSDLVLHLLNNQSVTKERAKKVSVIILSNQLTFGMEDESR